MQGNVLSFPELVTAAAALQSHPLVSLLMLRSAEAAGRPEAAAHYAHELLERLPGDVDATRAVAVDLVRRAEYAAAVKVIDRAELIRCIDEADPLEDTLDQLAVNDASAQVRALVTIGHFMHRETDPTRPVSDTSRSARQRWRAAYLAKRSPRRIDRIARLAILAGGIAVSLAVGNALPGVVVALALAAWSRTRALPGLDVRTSQLVRAINDPLQILRTRRYRPLDVFTLVFTLVVAGGLATQLPHRPSWLNAVETIAVFVAAIAATRGRRRWIRHELQRLLPPPLDPTTCCCLDAAGLHGAQSRPYVDSHLFRVGVIPGAPEWRLLQCLVTHTRFVDLPAAELTLRLPPAPPRQQSDRWTA